MAAASSAFTIQEYPEHHAGADYFGSPPAAALVEGYASPADGFLPIPDRAGLGVRLRPGISELYPPKRRPLRMRRFEDGSLTEL